MLTLGHGADRERGLEGEKKISLQIHERAAVPVPVKSNLCMQATVLHLVNLLPAFRFSLSLLIFIAYCVCN